MSADREQMWSPENPSRVGDEADDNPRVVANRLHALRRDVNDRLDRIGRALEVLVKIDAKLDVIIDRQNETDRRLDDFERRLVALETKDRQRAGRK